MATAKVGWKLKWDPDWPAQPSRPAKKGGEAIIFPGERYPDDHPVVTEFPDNFRLDCKRG